MGASTEEKMPIKCKFWLPKKKRFCANLPLGTSPFCGNHTDRSNDQWTPCPIDPSHSVLQENLEGHLKKCPFLKQSNYLSLQPFYQKGINGGKEEVLSVEEEDGSSSGLVDSVISSEMKRKAVYAMSMLQLYELLGKISTIDDSISDNIRDSHKIPESCNLWINHEVDRKLPFQEKHVLQQASILGNLEEFGVLRSDGAVTVRKQLEDNGSSVYGNDVPAVVEFGAGRGYLTQMLADCYGINKVILVERRSYKLKADRSLRQKESLTLERLRIDIEDLNLNAVDSLKGIPYLAIGKHLCGPATDITLRCCLGEQSLQENVGEHSAKCQLRGLALATCCHHLCQWKHYINQKYMSTLGISKEEFHAITWFTSWAVDGGHDSGLSGGVDTTPHVGTINEEEECGWDIDTCGAEEILKKMTAVERAVIGLMCKRIIDMGRFMWLKEQGLESELVKYVTPNISPENHLLIAKCKTIL